MDQNQRELRQAAAQAFMESLNQLGKNLQPSEADKQAKTPPNANPAKPQPTQPNPLPDNSIDLQALEAAAADIEQFMQANESVPKAEER